MKHIIFRLNMLLFFIVTIETLSASTIYPDCFKLNTNQSEVSNINKAFLSSDTIIIDENIFIEGVAISGKINLLEKNSFVRILLIDQNNIEYVILETSQLYNNNDSIILIDYCEETKSLFNIKPTSINIYLNNSILYLENIIFNYSDTTNTTLNEQKFLRLKQNWQNEKFEQAQYVVNQINEYNQTHQKLWRAEITDISLLPWNERKRILGIDGDCTPNGFEYYASGIFEIGENILNNETSSNSPYVDNFDWRNRHGINWITSVKHQSTGGSCWAFAAIGVTEALVNLYYNNKIDLDLSEQEIVSCSGGGSNANGGHADLALKWIANNNVSDENAFPFSNSDEPCSNKGVYNELISINSYHIINNHRINNNDEIKRALIKYGPLTSGFRYNNGVYRGHAMTLVGYATLHEGDTIRYFESYNQSPINFDVIQANDSRIGKTYWIFKNSYGDDLYYQHNGYVYIMFNDQSCFNAPYYATTPITSLNYSDTDIAITDRDGDGYYYWGIGDRPSHCPIWVPNEPDGDDSDYTKGPMNEYGYLYNIQEHTNDSIFLSSDTTWTQKQYLYNIVIIPQNTTLTITAEVTFYKGTKIILDGGSLIINGGRLYNADILCKSDSFIKLTNHGYIERSNNKSLSIPTGTRLEIKSGHIK